MPVGEILVREGWTFPDEIESALADQQIAGKRICSLLIVRGFLEPDQAARALSELHGVPAALSRHFENREKGLERILPNTVARQHCALPLGRMRDGELVICVRDPAPELQEKFERIVKAPVLITVAAAHTLEHLVEMAYPANMPQDIVRFARPSSQPANVVQQPPPPVSFAAGTEVVAGTADFDIDIDEEETPTFTIVDLDDAGVDKDFSMHDTKTPTTLPPGHAPARPSTLPPLNTKSTTVKK